MDLRKKAIVGVAVAGAVAAGGAGAYAATNTNHDPQPASRMGGHGFGPYGFGGGPGGYGHGPQLPAGTQTVIEALRTAVLGQASGIVTPIIDQAVTAGKLTAAQAATAKQALADLQAGKRPSADAMALLRDANARAVASDAFAALAKQLPTIAAPVLSDAVSKGTIDQATADQITARIKDLSDRAAQGGGFPFFGGGMGGPGFGGGKGGPAQRGYGPGGHRGGGFGGGPGKMGSSKSAGVFGDIAQAVAKQASTIAGPIIDKAASAGTITSAQADELRSAASDLASGNRGSLMSHRDLLSNSAVRGVVQDIFKAVATQTPAIAKPIIAQAVTDGKLTQAQADELTQHLADAAKRAGG
jgi:polyhydroxyalkanoate synthesis regulator phasin